MAIRIKFSDYALKTDETLTQRIQFVYSPLHELFRSLHVLLNPRHHGTNIDWILSIEKGLTKKFYQDLHYFSLFYELGVAPLLLANFKYHSNNLDDELQQLKAYLATYPVDKLLANLKKVKQNRENSFIPNLAKGLEWQDYQPQSSEDLLEDLAQKPSLVYQRLYHFIDWYRQNIFDKTWEERKIGQKILGEIKKQSQYLRQTSIREMFNHLESDRIHWQGQDLLVTKPFEETLLLDDKAVIVLLPSYFIWPHLFVDSFEQGICLSYALTQENNSYAINSKGLTTIFKALSDPVRLQILHQLADKPSTTQSLAQILLMSNSAISRHLQILKEAKLLESRKSKKFVLYQPTDLLTQVIPDFYQFFDE
ncbi:ArsR/SmtB family transcription factor [Streptococcus sobrinus]|uniref:ArsR/SmtB family transcription factor n=1 Tax=Streptococcus sobrinus TaxID=1310 RepID=UPI0002F42000|nr:metalloregulator ArsR/SmtB family transcription factor [Streptococcus sobrinus]